jgi:prepilin signal peptidase PulO-like enzyme (type II secretory pathway)
MVADLGTALIGALIFGAAGVCGALLGTLLIPKLQRFEDGPAPVDVHPAWLIAGAALLGAIVGWRQIPETDFVISALATVCLVAIWYCDARTGIIPDVFTLIPLGALMAYALFARQPFTIVSAVALFVPFGFLALISKGRGMGWGDAKLASLGGALIGLIPATFAFVVASFVAALVTWLRYRQRNVPVALGPYLVAAIAVCIALQTP